MAGTTPTNGPTRRKIYCFPTDEWEPGYKVRASQSKFGDSIAFGDFVQDLKLILRSNKAKNRKPKVKTIREEGEDDDDNNTVSSDYSTGSALTTTSINDEDVEKFAHTIRQSLENIDLDDNTVTMQAKERLSRQISKHDNSTFQALEEHNNYDDRRADAIRDYAASRGITNDRDIEKKNDTKKFRVDNDGRGGNNDGDDSSSDSDDDDSDDDNSDDDSDDDDYESDYEETSSNEHDDSVESEDSPQQYGGGGKQKQKIEAQKQLEPPVNNNPFVKLFSKKDDEPLISQPTITITDKNSD